MSVVLDASVIAKCLVPEPDSDKSKALMLEWTQGRLDVIAPDILRAEVAGVLWKRATRGLISSARSESLYRDFVELGIPTAPIEDLVGQALRMALRYRHSVYDGLYVVLALDMGWDFVTANERLYNALSPSIPRVQLLRNWV